VATVLSILDRNAWNENTDVIVRADPARRSLTWIPRDLWSPGLRDRISRAFAQGGNERLLAALAELGFPCEHALCLRRAATERALAGLAVEVPVEEPIDLWYPLAPTRPIEEGRKMVSFRPPRERLEGERIHQWIGARLRVDRPSSDLERLARQQVFLRALLEQGFDFASVIAEPNLIRLSGDGALEELRQVDARWRMATFDRVLPATIDGKMVLEAREHWRRVVGAVTTPLVRMTARLRRSW
jgi:anionic cell wall polymer biosynthesis LytR-Cps2A-Psr (LCP) family protein